MPMPDKCLKCNKPKELPGKGIVTSFIEVCQCDNIQFEQSQTITFCQICSRRVAKSEGSLTQWVFGRERCECERPQPSETPVEKLISPSFIGFRDAKDEAELELEAHNFPVERYKAILELGHGAAGKVYLARDRVLGKRVAIKILHELTGEQLVSFQDEARATARLDHPNIVRILDFGASESGTPYMVMEYVPGISLEKFLSEKGPLSENFARQVFSKLTEALKYAHNHSVYHRDLKPSNIILYEADDEVEVCLIDFGVARVKEATGLVTTYQSKTLAGTPSYMSPDPINGEVYDERSEIYCLGCVLFEALAGRPPFEGDSALEILALHTHEPPPELADYDLELSREISDIVLACMAKNKSDRFDSMDELGEALLTKFPAEDLRATGIYSQNSHRLAWYRIWLILFVFTLAGSFAIYQLQSYLSKPVPKTKIKLNTIEEVPSPIDQIMFNDSFRKLSKSEIYRIVNGADRNGPILFQRCDLTKDTLSLLAGKTTQGILLQNCLLDEGTFANLKKVRALETLEISSCRFLRESVWGIAELEGIEKLLIRDPSPSQAEMHSVEASANLKSLKSFSLYLRYREFSNTFVNIGKLKNLRELAIGGKLDKSELASLVSLSNLRKLDLAGCYIDSSALEGLSKLEKLESLRVNSSFKSAKCLSLFPSLVHLDLSESTVSDPDLFIVLSRLSRLKFLILDQTRLTGIKPRSLEHLKSLQLLMLGTGSMQVLENCTGLKIDKVMLMYCQLPDEVFRELKKQNKIGQLKMNAVADTRAKAISRDLIRYSGLME